jgi:hypothetical protein
MNWQLATLIGLVATAGAAAWRTLRRPGRAANRWLQAPMAVLLYLLLYPPAMHWRGDAVTIMTPGASPRQSIPWNQSVIALPGAFAPARAEAAPDLATALRRHATVAHLTVVGAGLPPRDRTAALGLAIEFRPAAERGLVELEAPGAALLGREWQLAGRAAGPARRVELRDPSGAVVDAVDVDMQGRFRLSAAARGPGRVEFELRLLDEKQTLIDRITVPMLIQGGQTMSVIVRAGAISPELKYWRRWAADAGIRLALSAGLTEAVSLREGDARLTPAALAQADVVIVDARAWGMLQPDEKTALRAAVDQGLGLLLRIDAPLDAATTADWSALGYRLSAAAPGANAAAAGSGTAAAGEPRTVTIDRRMGLRERTPFTAADVAVTAAGAVTMLRADAGEPLGWWLAQGQGRVGLWRLIDSYRLILLGEPGRYASLWAETLGELARPRAAVAAPPRLPAAAWVNERIVLCGVDVAAQVAAPDAAATALAVTGDGCAAYWPSQAGWHTLQTRGGTWPFYVRATTDGATLRAALDRRATASMAGPRTNAAAEALPPPPVTAPSAWREPMSRWPWFFGWMLVSAAVWWYERRA